MTRTELAKLPLAQLKNVPQQQLSAYIASKPQHLQRWLAQLLPACRTN